MWCERWALQHKAVKKETQTEVAWKGHDDLGSFHIGGGGGGGLTYVGIELQDA